MSNLALLWTAQAVALVGWIALLLAPKFDASVRLARAVGVALSAGYLFLFVSAPQGFAGLVADYSPERIGAIFSDPRLALLGWVHYLAFDLWVGAWETEEARRAGMPHGLLVPCLLLTCLLGPIGLLLFLGLRAYRRSRKSIAN